MTTGMRRDEVTAERTGVRGHRFNWLEWLLLAIAIAAALVSWSVYRSNQLRNEQAQNGGQSTVQGAATTQPGSGAAQQNAADGQQAQGTGQQGSVGNLPEKLAPAGGKTGKATNNDATGAPGSVAASGKAEKGGVDTGTVGGAGNTGISTATDAVGGAPVKGGQGAGTSPSKAPQIPGGGNNR